MAQFQAIDWGSAVSPELSGIHEAEAAAQEHGQKLAGAVQNLGQSEEGAAGQLTQNVLHRQAMEATADAARGTAQAQAVLEANPFYITHDTLTQNLEGSKADELWNNAKAKNLTITDKDGLEYAPTFTVGRELYTAMTDKSRADAAEKISLPGWRAEFSKTAEVESLSKMERYINPMMGRYSNEYNKAKTLQSAREMADKATTPEEFGPILSGIKGSPSLSPDEKLATYMHYAKLQDTVIADKAMTNPVAQEDVLKKQLTQLQGPNAHSFYPNLDVKEREELANQVEGKLKFVDVMREHQQEMQVRADRQADDQLGSTVIKGILTGNVNPQNFYSRPGVPDSGFGEDFVRKMKTREGNENLFHFIESYMRNEQTKPAKDRPGVFQALTSLYANDIDGFKQAMETHGSFNVPRWGNVGPIDLSKDLSPESFKHWSEKYAGLADKDRAREDSQNEGRMTMRVGAAITSADGGRAKASDWADPIWRVEHLDLENFVTGQLAQANKDSIKRGGQKLTPAEEDGVLLKAAKTYADTGGDPDHFFGAKENRGTGIVTDKGARTLGQKERSYIEQGFHAAGMVGTPDLGKDGTDFYNNYTKPINSVWQAAFGKEPDLQDMWNIYYRAQASGLPGEQGVTKAINDIYVKQKALKKGGDK